MEHGRGDKKGKTRIIPLALAFVFFTNNLVNGFVPLSSTARENKTNVDPKLMVEWTPYNLHGRIVNGTKAALRQFPYQVSLRETHNLEHFCGGSLIAEHTVLTAAHCMFEETGDQVQPWRITVVAGNLKLSQLSETGQKRGVDEIHVHAEFNPKTLENDIALLALKVPFKLTPEVNVAPLADNSPIPDTICQVAGWGYPAEDYPVTSENLMYVDLPLLSRGTCKKLLEDITDFPPGMLCAGYIEGQKDACQGDSGGGMICKGILTGVVSGGNGCARPRSPGVYTDVNYYKKWIATRSSVRTQATKIPFEKQGSGSEQVMATTLLLSILLSLLLNV
ncbi:trypsin-like isoform X1 [Frieseomelitta varia]|uniref:trypsin-like isoform X1 n=1 Tax=Frieseomelitta varia TaxID=561572 RepID=UPI001CB6AC2D|nr:trypsin-like isoform X1 [Frieseomelitta varia]